MTLEKALSYAIDKEGIAIVAENRLSNYLSDLQAFDTPAVKRVITTMVEGGYFAKLQSGLASGNHELIFNDVASKLVQNEGFQSDLVQYILDCLLFAVYKTGNAPIPPASAINNNTTIKKPSKVSATLDVIQANNKFLVQFNGQSYELDENQYKAIVRKKNMPVDRLEIWLRTYAEENN